MTHFLLSLPTSRAPLIQGPFLRSLAAPALLPTDSTYPPEANSEADSARGEGPAAQVRASVELAAGLDVKSVNESTSTTGDFERGQRGQRQT